MSDKSNIDSTVERIELHCHSKLGGNATMYAGEALRFASMRGMPALAIADTANILSFPELESVRKHGDYDTRPIYAMEMLTRETPQSEVCAVTVLVKNKTGKENLYRLISENLTESAYPVYEFGKLMDHRNGLLLGSGAENGKLRRLAKEGASDEEIRKALEWLDYVELLPCAGDKAINERLADLCEKAGIPAVAVSDAVFLEKEDRTAWLILNDSLEEAHKRYGMHLLTTDEMLEAFSYLSKEKAREIVIDNTHRIADMCETVQICPDEKHYPKLENADERLRELCEKALKEKYDDDLIGEAGERLKEELVCLARTDMAFHILLSKDLMDKTQLRSCDISTRGTCAGSIVLYLLGITEIDPLKYHLLPETIYGRDGARRIDIDLNVPTELQGKVQGALKPLDGIQEAIHAGSIKTISHYRATEMIELYEQYNYLNLDPEQNQWIYGKISGNYVGRGKHPGGMILIPDGYDYIKDMPICLAPGGIECIYFDFYFVDRAFFKADILASYTLDALRDVALRTGVDLASVPKCSEEALSLFAPDEDGRVTKCAELPEYRSENIREMVATLRPESFEDLVKLMGLAHSTGAWLDNGEKLIREKGLRLSDLIASRDDVFDFLLEKGMERSKAFAISEAVRKGMIARGRNSKWNEWKEEMLQLGVPEWFLWSCQHIEYLFPRAHDISYLFMNMRLAWFKIHYPEEFASVMNDLDL